MVNTGNVVDKYINVYILALIAVSVVGLVITSFTNLSEITGNPLALLFATVLPLLLFYGLYKNVAKQVK